MKKILIPIALCFAAAAAIAFLSGCKSTTMTAYVTSGTNTYPVHITDRRCFLTSKATISATHATNGTFTVSVDVASDPNAAALKAVMDGAANVTGAAVGAAVKAAVP